MTEYDPDVVSPPGETLQELLEERGMPQSELAQGRTAITPEIALQLERELGVPASFWLKREQLYREYIARLALDGDA